MIFISRLPGISFKTNTACMQDCCCQKC